MTIADPLDKRYVVVKKSEQSPESGEGGFARVNVPARTIYSLYGGNVLDPVQVKISFLSNQKAGAFYIR